MAHVKQMWTSIFADVVNQRQLCQCSETCQILSVQAFERNGESMVRYVKEPPEPTLLTCLKEFR